jgi:hypothetical protein
MPRIAPTELDIWLAFEEAGSKYADIAQCLALLNRRGAYRQGMQYGVQDVTLFAGNDAIAGTSVSTLIIERLPHTWVSVNAWTKSYEVWQRSEHQVIDVEPSMPGKWRDFKVFMDTTHANQSNQLLGNLCPVGYGDWDISDPTAGTLGYDWVASEIVIPNDPASTDPEGDEAYFLHMVGGNNGTKSKSMIYGYATSRARPVSPDPNKPAITSWMVEAFDDGDNLAQIEGNVRAHNDEPPYYLEEDASSGAEYYPGGSNFGDLAVVADLTATQYQTQKSSGPFLANCGLLKLTLAGSVTGALVRVRVSAGTHHGVMARSMRDVN